MQLPSPLLGNISALTITSANLEQSFEYYKLLGFSEVFRADWPFPWIQITDGQLLIMLRKDVTPYIALTYYVNDIVTVVTDLKSKGITFVTEPKPTDMVQRYLLQSPDGLNISLVSIIEGFHRPSGPSMLEMPQQDYFNPEKYVNKTCGLFAELAHPVMDLKASITFWQLLGFKALSTFGSPYPWSIISDGLSVVGLHQTENFTTPAMTFFASDMKLKNEKLIAAGLSNFTKEGDTNLVLSTPEHQRINLYKFGM